MHAERGPVQPPALPSPDEVAAQFGAPLFTFVAQPRLAEWAINAERTDETTDAVAVLYWYFDDPHAPAYRDSLWEAVRTARPRDPQPSLAEATARHLEHVIRNVGGRPEHMSLEEWMRWNPLPAVHDVRDTTLVVNGAHRPAVTIELPRWVGYGTIIGDSTVTIAGDRAKLDTIDLALVER